MSQYIFFLSETMSPKRLVSVYFGTPLASQQVRACDYSSSSGRTSSILVYRLLLGKISEVYQRWILCTNCSKLGRNSLHSSVTVILCPFLFFCHSCVFLEYWFGLLFQDGKRTLNKHSQSLTWLCTQPPTIQYANAHQPIVFLNDMVKQV